jgi:hypothetical protein
MPTRPRSPVSRLRHVAILALAIPLLVALGLVSAEPAQASSSTASFLKNVHSGLCAEVPGRKPDPGVLLDQWSCVNQNNVKWVLDYVAGPLSSGTYLVKIRNVGTQECINDRSGAGTAVIQYYCSVERDPNYWEAGRITPTQYHFRSVSSPKCLSVTNQVAGSLLSLAACEDASVHHEQLWDFRGGLPMS